MRRRCFVGVVVVTVLVVVLLLWACPGSPSYKDSRGTAARATVMRLVVSTPTGLAGCDSAFFDVPDQQQVLQWFGGTQFCGFSPAGIWYDFVSYQVPPQGSAGPAVLVDRCAAGDTTCSSVNVIHQLSDFTVYPAPDPNAALVVLGFLGTAAPNCLQDCFVPIQDSTLVVVTDGQCGTDIFDLDTGLWYSDAMPSAEALAEGNTSSAEEIPAPLSYSVTTQTTPPAPGEVPALCSSSGTS